VSTAVSPFTAAQPALRKPGGAKATAFGDAVQVCWKATKGALAYEVRKRLKGQNSGRLFPSDAATHEYFEGDGETDGFGHVEYVPASQTCHVDQGQIVGFLRPLGLSDPKSFQYGVRVLSLNSNNTIGISQTEVVDAAEQQEFQVSTTIYSGVVPVGVAGSNLVNGVDYVDVPFEGEPGVIGVNAALDTNPNLGALPDVDFVLLEDTDGDGDCAAGCNQIASSGNFGPNEFLSVVIVPGRTYVYRVVGFANAGTLFTIKSDQFIAAVAP
jgi:hypothetical protein